MPLGKGLKVEDVYDPINGENKRRLIDKQGRKHAFP